MADMLDTSQFKGGGGQSAHFCESKALHIYVVNQNSCIKNRIQLRKQNKINPFSQILAKLHTFSTFPKTCEPK